MARKPTGNPNGRPSKINTIDQEQFEKLCALQCTKEEIAGFFNVSPDSIENYCAKFYGSTFSAVFAEKRCAGKISLRRAQFKLAEKNAAMAIFLGKNYLGQRDVIEETNTDTIDKLDDILNGVRANAAAIAAAASAPDTTEEEKGVDGDDTIQPAPNDVHNECDPQV